MNQFKFLITGLCFLFALNGFAQNNSKQKKIEDRKVDIFSDEERANLQLHFYDKIKEMNLTEGVEEDYYGILSHYVFDMQRLDDKDKDFTESERKTKLEALVVKMNGKIKDLLPDDKFKMHLKTFNDILKSVYLRNNWEFKEE